MLKTTVAFFVAISLNGEEVTRVGPLTSPYECEVMQRDISSDIENSFKTSTPYGIGGDLWGIGGGAIFRFKDYDFSCVRLVVDMKTSEVLEERYYD